MTPRLLVNGREAKSFLASATVGTPAVLFVDGLAVDPTAEITLPAGHLAAALLTYQETGMRAVADAVNGVQAKKAAVVMAAAVLAARR